MEIRTIGMDLAKSVCALSCADERGQVVARKLSRRAQVLKYLARIKPCLVGLEACGGAHCWARAARLMARRGPNVAAVALAAFRQTSLSGSASQTSPMVARGANDLMANRPDRCLPTLLCLSAHAHEAVRMIRDPDARTSIMATGHSIPARQKAAYMTATSFPKIPLQSLAPGRGPYMTQ
ncbi:MAG: hypothetical protein ACREP6_13915 [Candidatus Binataceae bacterium]